MECYLAVDSFSVPVDRILRKQMADRQAAEDLIREKSKQLALLRQDQVASAPPVNLDHKPPSMATTASTDVTSTSGSHDSASLRPQSDPTVSRPPSMIRNSLGNWRRKFTGKDEHAPRMPGGLPVIHDEQQPNNTQPLPSGPSSRPRTPQTGVTPQSNIGKFSCVLCRGISYDFQYSCKHRCGNQSMSRRDRESAAESRKHAGSQRST